MLYVHIMLMERSGAALLTDVGEAPQIVHVEVVDRKQQCRGFQREVHASGVCSCGHVTHLHVNRILLRAEVVVQHLSSIAGLVSVSHQAPDGLRSQRLSNKKL